MARHNELGKWGEQYAADYLQGLGYDIIERDWRIGHRDIDIIARTSDVSIVMSLRFSHRATNTSCAMSSAAPGGTIRRAYKHKGA